MNLLKKGIFALLAIGLIASCDDDDAMSNPDEGITGTGLTEITFPAIPSTSVKTSGDGTIVTIRPQGLGVTSYEVDFGDAESTSDVVIITEDAGKASYDYPNNIEEETYTITVTAKSDQGFAEVVQTKNVLVEHEITAVSSAPSAPTVGLEEVLSIYSSGIEYNGSTISYRYKAAGIDLSDGAAQYAEVTTDSGNKVAQYSRLSEVVGASIGLDGIVVADAFDTGIAATHIHFDVHSEFAIGIDKLKIILVDGSTEYVFNQDLTDGEWINLDLDLATDFSAPVVQFEKIKFELGAGGTANDAATLNLDNVYLHKPISSMIQNGDFTNKTDHWRFTTFTDGTTTPFGSSSDGSWTNYDGSDNGSKTAGAKWTSSQSGEYLQTSGSRYAYQALKLTPNTDYVLEYQYAIKNDSADEPIGGRRIVGIVLDGHYIDGANALDDVNSNLANYEGRIAEGKFSDSRRETVLLPFTTNDDGEIAVMFYAVTPKDAWIDNVKVYEAP